MDDWKRVIVENLEPKREHVAGQREWLQHRGLGGASLEVPEGFVQQIHPVAELVQQSRFPDPCLSHHGHDLGFPVLDRQSQCVLKHFEFRLAADHFGFHTLNAASLQPESPRSGPQHHIHFNGLRPAAHPNRRQLAHVEHPSDVGVGIM